MSCHLLHTDRVELERFEWRPLFPDDRLRNDTRGWKSQGKDDAEINNLLNRRRWRGSLVVDVKLGACNKVRALGGSWKGGLAVLGGAAPPAEQIRIQLNFLHSLAGGCQTGRSAKNLAKLQEQRIVAAREVLEFVGVGEELEETVALPRTRPGSSGCEAS